MSSPLSALKSLVGLDAPSDPDSVHEKTDPDGNTIIEPTSSIIEGDGDTTQTELKSSAPVAVPAQVSSNVAGVSGYGSENAGFAIVGDAEAGVALDEIMPEPGPGPGSVRDEADGVEGDLMDGDKNGIEGIKGWEVPKEN